MDFVQLRMGQLASSSSLRPSLALVSARHFVCWLLFPCLGLASSGSRNLASVRFLRSCPWLRRVSTVGCSCVSGCDGRPELLNLERWVTYTCRPGSPCGLRSTVESRLKPLLGDKGCWYRRLVKQRISVQYTPAFVSMCQDVPSPGLMRCHESVTRVSRECHESVTNASHSSA